MANVMPILQRKMLTPTKSPNIVPVADFSNRTRIDRPRSLIEHLDELRGRILQSLVWVAILSVGAYFVTDYFIHIMAGMVGPLVYLRPTEAFMVKLKLAVVLGVFASAPVLLYHMWRYIGVALTVSERRVLFGALPFSYLLFAAGAALSWYGVTPAGLKYLTSFSSPDLHPVISVESCFDFTFALTLGMGLLFQLPLILAALAWWGIIDAAFLIRYRKHAFLIILVVSGIVTPGPDIVSQLLLTFPTYALFELSIILARFCHPDRRA
jgi:sec-independent protein translocase protein TatC